MRGSNLTIDGMTFTNCSEALDLAGATHLIINTTFINNCRALRLSSNTIINIINSFFLFQQSSAIIIVVPSIISPSLPLILKVMEIMQILEGVFKPV